MNVLFAVIGSLTTYNLIYILTDGQFGTNTLGMLAFNDAFGQTADLGLGAAVTIRLFVVAVCVAMPLAALSVTRTKAPGMTGGCRQCVLSNPRRMRRLATGILIALLFLVPMLYVVMISLESSTNSWLTR